MRFLLLLLLLAVINSTVAASKTTDLLRQMMYKLCHSTILLSWLCGSGMGRQPEYSYGEKSPSFLEQVRIMEQIDSDYDRRFQESLAENRDVLIIAPTPTLTYNLDSTQTTYNPKLYSGGTYNIAFRIGSKYPADFPYLTVYLTKCSARNQPRTDEMLPVKSMTVYSNESLIRELLNYQQTVSPVVKTRDNAWVFQWTVPSAAIIFPGVKYCFLFDMSSVNASTIKAEGFQKLSNVKPSHASSFVMPTEYYHHLRASDYFEIVASPSLFSEPWFARKFGGKDLERLVGGPLFSFSIVSSAYHGGDSAAQWDERRFLEHIDQRANYMADWFSKVIEESGKERFESGMHLGHLPNRLDTGYVQMEDRRRARARATGLLYHVNGRETLFTIGSALLDVSQEYYRGLLPFSKRPDPFRSHKSIVGKIMDYFDYKYSRYRSARRRLQKWIVELKKLCADSIPTVELMRDITAKFTGKHRKVRLPIIRRKVYLPSVIQAKIMENMRKMVDYEIRLIVSSMGDRLLRSATPTEHILSTVSRLNIYDAQKYTEYAAALRVYGSKFVAMANTFLPGLGYARLEDENVRCGLCFCFK